MQQLGVPLNRLIKERSYTSGRIKRLEAKRLELIAKAEEIRSRQTQLESKLEGVDAQIQELSRIKVEHIRAISPNEKISRAPYGHVMRGIVEFLRHRGPQPIRSDQLQEIVASLSGYSHPMRTKLKQRTSHICHTLKERGWIERLESQADPVLGRVFGMWRWIGNEAMNAGDKARGLHENRLASETTPAVVEPVR